MPGPPSLGLPTLLTLFLAVFLIPSPCPAECLYFSQGGRVQAPVVRAGGRVFIETPSGRYEFQDQDFRAIVPGGCPEQEWAARRAAVAGAGADRQFAAAWWAFENGLIPEAVAMLRSAHEADPLHQPAARLVRTLDRLDRPCSDPDTDPLRRALNVSCAEERGPHVLLLHQHDPAEARARVELLERVTTAYYLVLSAQGFDLPVPACRLVSVSLRDRNDYVAFLESQGATAFRTTLGYFHPNYRAVVTIDPRPTGPPTAGIETSSASNPARSDAIRRRLLSDLDCRARSDGTAAHELIHLLVTESGFSPEVGDFPLWLHEGFAAQFEVIRGGRWAGVGRAHDLRLPDWRSACSTARLEPLLRDAGFGHGYRRDVYAQSWSLVFFLRKTRPGEFSTFLDLLRTPDPDSDRSDPARFASRFRTAFGADVRALEQEWHSFIGSTRTPLEENDPD